MTSTFTVRDSGECLEKRKCLTKWRYIEVGFLYYRQLCLFYALDGDALYSRSDPSDLDMVKIEPNLLLYDHDSRSNSSCSKENDIETVTFIFGH